VVADLRRIVARFEATVTELQESLAARDARIAELEKLLGESRRSGKRQAAPFSKGDPKLEPERPGRKTGHAHGRHGHRQAPPAAPDVELEAPLPGCCPHCGGDVEHERDAEQFVTDLPALPAPTTTRFRVAVGRCRSCGRRVQGRHPDQISDALGAAGAQVGPNAKAWSAWLHYTLGLSFEKITKLFADRFGFGVTAGALCQAAQSTGTDLVPVIADCRARLNDSSMVVMDETGWRINGASVWLWAATSRDVTVYNVAEGRGFDQACDLVDADYAGTIVRDGWAPYRRYEAATHQTCTAHLLRRCHELIEDLPAWARGTPREVKELLLNGLAARDLDAAGRAAKVVDLSERIDLLGEQAQAHDECRKLVKHLVNERDALFTFLTDPTIDATNWRGEQAIRPAVVNRKVSGGNRSPRGAVTQGRMMTVFRTAAQQGIDALDYLVHLARAPDPATVPFFTQ
jgi:transposase